VTATSCFLAISGDSITGCNFGCYKFLVLSCSFILAIWWFCLCFLSHLLWFFGCSYSSDITRWVW